MKSIRLFVMLAGALVMVGLALNQPVRAEDKSADCSADADQTFNDCMNNNGVDEDVCNYLADGAYAICMED